MTIQELNEIGKFVSLDIESNGNDNSKKIIRAANRALDLYSFPLLNNRFTTTKGLEILTVEIESLMRNCNIEGFKWNYHTWNIDTDDAMSEITDKFVQGMEIELSFRVVNALNKFQKVLNSPEIIKASSINAINNAFLNYTTMHIVNDDKVLALIAPIDIMLKDVVNIHPNQDALRQNLLIAVSDALNALRLEVVEV